jgi:LacI family transcriptional regulator
MARMAVELLVEALRLDRSATLGEIAEPHVQIDYTLIRRESDAPPRAG